MNTMKNRPFLHELYDFIQIRIKSTVFHGIATLNYNNISGYNFDGF